ncbi:flavin reductase [Aquibaculum sediminis]|uniref:flavin reductase n=1 Tax=Aquibaculum sediminis TaxID=3231907 RepID=UPI00345207FF
MSGQDYRQLRDAFGAFMTGVTVVTTLDSDGAPIGFTANSFSSVSLDPPLLLVSLAKTSRNFQHFAAAESFAVNILAEHQKSISNTFGRPVADRFSGLDWRTESSGAPILPEVSAWFDCRMERFVDAGDHAIMLDRIEAFDANNEPGLGYYRGTYFTPAKSGVAAAGGPAVLVSAILEQDGRVLLVERSDGALSLPEARAARSGTSTALGELIAASGLEASPGFIYAVYEDPDEGKQHISFLCPSSNGQPKQGHFHVLTPDTLHRVADEALRTMLTRFADESRLGNFGVYFGNQRSGQVRRVAQG